MRKILRAAAAKHGSVVSFCFHHSRQLKLGSISTDLARYVGSSAFNPSSMDVELRKGNMLRLSIAFKFGCMTCNFWGEKSRAALKAGREC